MVPFVGAGVSMAVRNKSGQPLFPSWKDALLEGARQLESAADPKAAEIRELVAGDDGDPRRYATAAREIRLRMGLEGWRKFLVELFDHSDAEIDQSSLATAEAIWQLGSRVVLTTNYDDVLEWAGRTHRPSVWERGHVAELAAFVRGEHHSPAIWHVHGHVKNKATMILTDESYEGMYRDEESWSRWEAARTALRTVLLTKSLLFVGFSLKDTDFFHEIQRTAKTFEGYAGEHFALLDEGHADREGELLELGITPIFYPTPNGSHAALVELLRHLGKWAPIEPCALAPRALPDAHDEFVGRRHEARELADSLIRGPNRLVALVGPSGSGKTRLSQRVARDVLHEFEGHVRFADLTGATTAVGLSHSVALALGLPLTGLETPVQTVLNLLPHQGRTLLVLDHFEQLVGSPDGAERSDPVEQLLRWHDAAKNVSFLVTSTRPLGVGTQIDLGPLEFPQLAEVPALGSDEAERFPSLALYSARRRERPRAEDHEDEEVTARLCALLAGLPLAIELAARMPDPPTAVDRRIGELLREIDAEKRPATSVSRELEAALRLAVGSLEQDERCALVELSVCSGGFFLPEAHAVLSRGTAEDRDRVLNRLADLGLLLRHEPTSYVFDRLAVAPPVRLWVTEHMVSGEDDTLRAGACERHREYYLSYSEERAAEVAGTEPRKAIELLTLELEDLVMIFRAARDSGDTRTAARALLAMAPVFAIRGPATVLSEHGEPLVEALGDDEPALRARLLIALCRDAGDANRFKASEAFAEAALEAAEEGAPDACRAAALCALAWARLPRPAADSGALAEDAHEIYAGLGDTEGTAWADGLAGRALHHGGGYREARALYDAALGERGCTRGTLLECELRRWRSESLAELGEFEAAVADLVAAEGIVLEVGFPVRHWDIRLSRANLELAAGEARSDDFAVERALKALEELRDDARLRGDRFQEALAVGNIADTYHRRAAAVAERMTEESAGIYEKLDLGMPRAIALSNLAAMLRDRGEGEAGLTRAREAYAVAREVGYLESRIGWVIAAHRARAEWEHGDRRWARQHARGALEREEYATSSDSEVRENWAALQAIAAPAPAEPVAG